MFYYIYLTCSFVLLTRTNHLVSDVCILYIEVIATALLVSNDRNLNLLQWSRGGQGHCGRESGHTETEIVALYAGLVRVELNANISMLTCT